jgi:L-alanine-DL-glutamate epimerase-like enolase superfamily enzyme
MQLSFQPLLLELKHPFRLATGMRTHTNAMLVQITLNGLIGYGEAAMPPYYGETHQTAATFLQMAARRLQAFQQPLSAPLLAAIMQEIDGLAPGNNAAKAAVDIALHDLWGKMAGRPLWSIWNISPEKMPPGSFTLGMDTPEVLRQKLPESDDFQILKIKLGSDDDRAVIRIIREMSDKPIYADANQGWTDREAALDLTYWLQEQGVQLIEQPFHKNDLDSAAWLTERSPLPVFADESFQRLADLHRIEGSFHGVNVKLMKCTGLAEAVRAIHAAREKGMQVMIGCMTETSCAISAAAQIAPLCDFVDLDGCWLIRNNPFEMPEMKNGRMLLSALSGLGLHVKTS